ncbi:MAG: prolyl oligopeptidase family serine peptidase [Candidatus Tyrphobacter sp.]
MLISPRDTDAGDPIWSPDGSAIAYYVYDGRNVHLWVWNSHTRETREASNAGIIPMAYWDPPVWSPNGWRLFAITLASPRVSDVNPAAGAVRADANSGHTTLQLLQSPTASQGSGGSGLRYDIAAIDVRTHVTHVLLGDLPAGNGDAELDISPNGEEIAYLLQTGESGSGPDRGEAFDLYLYDVATHGRRLLVRDVRDGEIVQQDPRLSWSPDSREIAYISIVHPITRPTTTFFAHVVPAEADAGALFVVSAATGAVRSFVGDPGTFSVRMLHWSRDGRTIFVSGENRLWHASIASYTMAGVRLSNHREINRDNAIVGDEDERAWSPDGPASIVVMTKNPTNDAQGFALVNWSTGGTRQMFERNIDLIDYGGRPTVSSRGTVAFNFETARDSGDIWIADASFRHIARLTTLNPQFSKYTFGRTVLIGFRGIDGRHLHAALLLPSTYQSGHRYPMLVWVYASSDESDAVNNFGLQPLPWNFQLLATRGYAVLLPDTPVHLGSPMKDLRLSVMPAVDKAIALGIADPNRLAVGGQSNGGYSALSIIVQTHRFKAAIVNSGFGDLTAFYGYMDAGGYSPWMTWLGLWGGAMGVPPWKDPQRYVENSPIYYLSRITTPILMEAGGADAGIVQFSDEVFADLKSLGSKVIYLRYRGEGHVLTSYGNMVDYFSRLVAFLRANLSQ